MPRRILQGVALNDARNKTVVIRVERIETHPLYKKVIRRTKKFTAHDETNTAKEGEVLHIRECRPISKRKHWEVLREGDDSGPKTSGGAQAS
jgi:small subunit ribosomal protein S17